MKYNAIGSFMGVPSAAEELMPNQNPVFEYEAGDLALVCDVAVGAIVGRAALFWLAVV